MADVLTEGRWKRGDIINNWRCECENGQVLYSENNPPNPCNYCQGTAPTPSLKAQGFRNMDGKKFSAKNFLIFAAIGAAAFFAYKKFVK